MGIQEDELTQIRESGSFICRALDKIRQPLGMKIALKPSNCSRVILEEVKTLSFEEITTLLINAEKEVPLWLRSIGPLFKRLLNSLKYALIDDMFEIDSKVLYDMDKKQFNDLLQLVYLVGLTIPEELAKGSRIETYFNTEESKDK
jgi:hypothetical protein